jgi:hypothetical protein
LECKSTTIINNNKILLKKPVILNEMKESVVLTGVSIAQNT